MSVFFSLYYSITVACVSVLVVFIGLVLCLISVAKHYDESTILSHLFYIYIGTQMTYSYSFSICMTAFTGMYENENLLVSLLTCHDLLFVFEGVLYIGSFLSLFRKQAYLTPYKLLAVHALLRIFQTCANVYIWTVTTCDNGVFVLCNSIQIVYVLALLTAHHDHSHREHKNQTI